MGEILVTTNEVDKYVGNRLQLRRTMLGLSQKALAEKCGVTFQQIQKYEVADNRISASRLFHIGVVMDTPVSFFFKGLPGNIPEETKANKSLHVAESQPDDPLAKNETLEIIRLYWSLSTDEQRKTIKNLLLALSNQQ